MYDKNKPSTETKRHGFVLFFKQHNRFTALLDCLGLTG